jgi:hypothetical protein
MDKLYLKLTTLPKNDELNEESLEFKVFKDKYEEHKGFVKDSDVKYAYYNEGGKNPSFGKIHSCTIGFVHNGELRIKVIKGKEDEILLSLFSTIENNFKDSTIVGFNFKFLLYFISSRIMANNINILSIPKQLRHFGLKPWNLKFSKDLQEYVVGVGWHKPNFKELCMSNNIDIDIIDGSDVNSFIKSGKAGDIDVSDINYLKALINLDRKSEGESLIDTISFSISEVIKEEIQEVVEPTIVEKIKNTGKLLKRDVDKVLKKFAGRPLKERADILKTIEALLLLSTTITKIRKMKQYQYFKEEILKEE